LAMTSDATRHMMMPSLSVVQMLPSRRRKDALALSSPPKPMLPSSNPSTNYLKPTGTSTRWRPSPLHLVEPFRPSHAGREAKYHYVLDRLDAFVVAVMALPDHDREVKVRWRTDQELSIATSRRPAHTVGANDLFVRLVAVGRHNPAAKLVTWWGERYCTANLGEVVPPDGVGVWREGDAAVRVCDNFVGS